MKKIKMVIITTKNGYTLNFELDKYGEFVAKQVAAGEYKIKDYYYIIDNEF
jgi:hypothetical protein